MIIPIRHQPTKTVDLESASVIDDSLKKLDSSSYGNAIALALRWYAKAVAYEAPADQFIAYFIGVDAMTNGYFASLEAVPFRKEFNQLAKYFEKAQPPIDHRLRDITLERFKDFPLSVKFELYWEHHFNKETRLGSKFLHLNRLRGELLHGKARLVSQEQMSDVKRMLEMLLGRELELDTLMNQGHIRPKVLEAKLRYVVQQSVADAS